MLPFLIGQLARNLYTLKQIFCSWLNCLSLKQLNLFILMNLIFLPKVFNNYFSYAKFCHYCTTRFSLKNHLTIPLFISNRTQRSIKYIGLKIWNSISHNQRTMTFNKFKKHFIYSFYFQSLLNSLTQKL